MVGSFWTIEWLARLPQLNGGSIMWEWDQSTTFRPRPTYFRTMLRDPPRPHPPSSLATAASTQRHILPSNLPAAIKQLNDGELDQLLSAVLAEQKRRGRRPPGSNESARNQHAQELAPPLTQGKLNAVRAAFKAGVTPSRIVRQFGVTPVSGAKSVGGGQSDGLTPVIFSIWKSSRFEPSRTHCHAIQSVSHNP